MTFLNIIIISIISFLLLLTAIDFPVRLDLYLKDDESVVVTLAEFPLFMFFSSLLNCYNRPEVSK